MSAHGSRIALPLRVGSVRPDPALEREPVRSQWREIWDRMLAQRGARLGICALIAIVLLCVLAPPILGTSPNAIDYSALHAAPSAHHLLGTDTLGRDELARLLAAGRVSLFIGFAVALLSAVFGTAVGLVAGYVGGRVDAAITVVTTALLTIPPIPLLAALSVLVVTPDSHIGAVVRGIPESLRIVVVLTCLGWMATTRVVRAQVRRIRSEAFVEASVALGAPRWRTMFLHILPSALPAVTVLTTLGVSAAIMAESTLSFLGVGVTPPTATWGNMIADASNLLSLLRYPWLLWSPAVAIFATVLSVNYVGEGIRRAVAGRERSR